MFHVLEVVSSSERVVCFPERPCSAYSLGFLSVKTPADHVQDTRAKQVDITSRVHAEFTCIWFSRRTPAAFTQAAEASLSVSISPQTNIEQKATGQADQKARMLTCCLSGSGVSTQVRIGHTVTDSFSFTLRAGTQKMH